MWGVQEDQDVMLGPTTVAEPGFWFRGGKIKKQHLK